MEDDNYSSPNPGMQPQQFLTDDMLNRREQQREEQLHEVTQTLKAVQQQLEVYQQDFFEAGMGDETVAQMIGQVGWQQPQQLQHMVWSGTPGGSTLSSRRSGQPWRNGCYHPAR